MSSEALFYKAQRLFIEGRHKESIDLFSECIQSNERRELSVLSRGVAYLRVQKLEHALADFGRAIEMNRENHRAFFYRGITYMSGEAFGKAIADFNRAIELKPDYGVAFFARGTARTYLGNIVEAERDMKMAIAHEGSISEICSADEIKVFCRWLKK